MKAVSSLTAALTQTGQTSIEAVLPIPGSLDGALARHWKTTSAWRPQASHLKIGIRNSFEGSLLCVAFHSFPNRFSYNTYAKKRCF
jgi:hypothetical protein